MLPAAAEQGGGGGEDEGQQDYLIDFNFSNAKEETYYAWGEGKGVTWVLANHW